MEKANNGNVLTFSRVFDAPRELVWKAWTEPEMIKKWWGPKGFTTPVAKIDFRVGGKYLYCMHGVAVPGQPAVDFWSTGEFKEILPIEKIVCTDSFSDKDGNIVKPTSYAMSPDFPTENVLIITFEEQGTKTKLSVIYTPESDVVREAMVKSGMEAGWNETLDKLAESLKS